MIRPSGFKKKSARQEMVSERKVAMAEGEGGKDAEFVGRLFDLEAAVGEEQATADSDEDLDAQLTQYQFQDFQGKWASKQSKTRKICRHFSCDLIFRAARY